MRYKLTFVAGLALGYVLGTAAGRERYEQLKKSARGIAQNPAVRNAAETAAHTGRQYAGKAFVAVGEHLPERLRVHHNGASATEDDWGTSNT
ncbi:YtxH domain-containing protein [Streptomyces sp. NPDC101132]|uniref:YtxH domain-containing protein n=1 Tax=Streptomyces sp. NPDC101132 TaxID=3366110 RepID=UPI00381B80A0